MELEMINEKPLTKDDYAKLATARQEFTKLCEDVNKVLPIRVMWAARSGAEQHQCFLDKTSKLDYPPGGKHNVLPLSEAIDATPTPYDPEDLERICFMAGMFMMAAFMRGIKLRWGRDWDGDTDLNDQTFNDYFHFELVT
jgi:peptidoglycan LD-endopeptidase CwlK